MPKSKHVLGIPDRRHIFGTVKVGEKGQIVIPKEAREMFGVGPGDSMVLLCDKKKGMALQTADKLKPFLKKIFDSLPDMSEEGSE